MRLQDTVRDSITKALRVVSQSVLGAPGRRTGVRIIRAFRQSGALSRSTAQRYRASNESEAEAFRGLLTSEIIKPAGRGRFYLDQDALDGRLDWQLLDAWLGWRFPS